MSKAYLDSIRGALYGVAVGDALGAPLEFRAAESIERQHGTVRDMIGGGWLDVKPGEITDDTQMTICVCEGICERPDDPVPAIGKRFVEWHESHPKDIGATCSTAIRIAIEKMRQLGADELDRKGWTAAAEAAHYKLRGQSAGNGSLMRTVYPGLFYADEKQRDLMAEDISTMTHRDWMASDACIIYSAIIWNMTLQERPETRRKAIRAEITRLDHEGRYRIKELHSSLATLQPTGFVVDSFKCALHCVLTTDNFEDAVVKAVNLGGDADTIGAITGGIAGALYGYSAIPERWVSALDGETSNRLERFAQAAYEYRNDHK